MPKTKFTVTEVTTYTFDTGDIRPAFLAAVFRDNLFAGNDWHFQDFAPCVEVSHDITYDVLPDPQVEVEDEDELVYIEEMADAILDMKPSEKKKRKTR